MLNKLKKIAVPAVFAAALVLVAACSSTPRPAPPPEPTPEQPKEMPKTEPKAAPVKEVSRAQGDQKGSRGNGQGSQYKI